MRSVAIDVANDKSRYSVDLGTGCWIWSGARIPAGYGAVRIDGELWLAHRLFYAVFVGAIPDGYVVHHRCRNSKCCVNPAHLTAITQQEHSAIHIVDSAKLTTEDVVEIRRLYSEGELNQREISEIYGVTPATISHIVNGKTWRFTREEGA